MGSNITNDARCTCEIKSRISMANATFNRKKTLFITKFDLNLWKKLLNCYTWSISFSGAKTWTLKKNRPNIPGKSLKKTNKMHQ